MQTKKTLVLGASPKPDRYAYKAIHALREQKIPVVAVGYRKAEVADVDIDTEFPTRSNDIHTVTMYLSVRNQGDYIESILNLQPKRVIFNPGSENPRFANQLTNQGVEVLNACTLVMLSVGSY